MRFLLFLLTGVMSVAGADFHGFTRVDFEHAGRKCILVKPKETAAGKPWIWRARFFGHEPQTDIALLNAGWHVAYVDVAGLFGSPKAVAIWDEFYRHLTEDDGFHRRPALEGMSRGGLIIFNWAKRNPDKVSCIYADAPVCDFKSWPGGKGSGKGSPNAWKQCLAEYGMDETAALTAKVNPIEGLEALARARVPLLHVVGDADEVVPVAENTAIVEARYRKLGGPIEVIHKPGVGHHPHSLNPPDAIVDFILKHQRDVTIVLAGDSTVTDKAGWGAAFAGRFRENVAVINLAKGGRSSKSFRAEGVWQQAVDLKPDYLFVQFGHNDCPGKGPERETDPDTSFRENMARYATEARAAGSRPVLVTSMTRRRYREGRIESILTPYAAATRAAAKQTGAALIDLFPRSVDLYNRLGDERAAELNPPDDRTHFNAKGAAVITDLILEDLRSAVPELVPFLRPAGQ
jgi:lysophospholipase L1-like esterase/pimeloyl-ACP methyl ester carboxylesterase